ncbi:hypothetical protein MNBD_UNCLBAC01-472, partial [hydrothermal vent metagenome]
MSYNKNKMISMTFFSLLHPYRKKIFFILFCIFFANVLALSIPWGVKMVIDDVLINKDSELLRRISISLFGILILRAVVSFFHRMTGNIVGEHVVCDLREKVYWHTRQLSLNTIKKITPAQILTRITGDVQSVRKFIFGDVIDLVYSILSAVLILSLLLWINAKLTLVALLMLPFFILFYMRLLPNLKKGYKSLSDISGKINARIQEVLNGIAVVRAFTNEHFEHENFCKKQGLFIETAKRNHFLNILLWIGIDVFTSLGTIGVLWLGGLDVI